MSMRNLSIEEQVEEFDYFLQHSGDEVSWKAIGKKLTTLLEERDRIAYERGLKDAQSDLMNNPPLKN